MNNDQMIQVCKRHILPQHVHAVVPEPYIPYIPDKWNAMLVLAEAQNLSSGSFEYKKNLIAASESERLCRLANHRFVSDPDIGVQPWDDGSLKVAVESAFGVKAEETGVSNAVFWSQVDESGRNTNPSDDLIALSINLWRELLPVVQPEQIVTSGNIAHDIIDAVESRIKPGWGRTKWRLPSRTAMSRVSGMFPENDLLNRYDEVRRVIEAHPEWLDGGYRQNKIFFACHAVSVVRAGKLSA